jgi:TolA-binding protein
MLDTDEQLFWEIEDYLNHRMDEGQRAAFEKRLNESPDLQESLALVDAMNTDLALYFQSQDDANLKAELMERGRSMMIAQKKAGRRILLRWSAVAAAVIAFFVVFRFTEWFDRTGNLTASAIYQQYFQSDDVTGAGLLSADASDDPLARVYQQLEAKQYQEAIDSIQHLLQQYRSFEQRPKAMFLLGIAQLNLEHPKEAIEAFGKIPPSAKTIFQRGEWYTAAAYLQMQDVENCRLILNSIAENPKHLQQQQAAEVLNLLR